MSAFRGGRTAILPFFRGGGMVKRKRHYIPSVLDLDLCLWLECLCSYICTVSGSWCFYCTKLLMRTLWNLWKVHVWNVGGKHLLVFIDPCLNFTTLWFLLTWNCFSTFERVVFHSPEFTHRHNNSCFLINALGVSSAFISVDNAPTLCF